MTANRWKRTGTIIGNTLTVLLAVAVLLLAFTLLQSRLTGSEPALAGYRLCFIKSGSMEPAVPVGSAVLVRALAAEEVRRGDIITFRSGGSLVTHRVDHLDGDDQSLLFYTKGDANAVVDRQPVTAAQVVGRVTLVLPYLGYALAYIRTREGLTVLLALAAMIILIGIWRTSAVGKEKDKPNAGREVGAK